MLLGFTTPKGFSSELSLKIELYNIIKVSKLSRRDILLVTQPVFIKAIDVMENSRIHEKTGECSSQKKKKKTKISMQNTSELHSVSIAWILDFKNEKGSLRELQKLTCRSCVK